MVIIVAGHRDKDPIFPWLVRLHLDSRIDRVEDEIITGGCPTGIDRAVKDYAEERDIKHTPYPAHWAKYGPRAGPLRNKELAEKGEKLIAFMDRWSKGTGDMVRKAVEENRMKVEIIPIPF